MSDFYAEMMSRNWAFVSPAEQERIRGTRVLLAGCGLGSSVAVLACRTGFTRFVCVDYDTVEVSNLNRQAFDRRHVGQNKALALKSILEEHSEDVHVEALPTAITVENADDLVEKADVVINTVDFDETMLRLDDSARKRRVPSLSPLNLGWAQGFCLVSTPGSTSLRELLGNDMGSEDAVGLRMLERARNWEAPDYFARAIREGVEERAARGYNPQLGIGVWGVAVAVVDTMVRLTLDLPVLLSPDVMSLSETLALPRAHRG